MGFNKDAAVDLSVVIPSYNSAQWLPSTLSNLEVALAQTSWNAEIVVVDDGSTDESEQMLQALATTYSYRLRIVSQANQGRFLARWAGLQAAEAATVLLLDSRVLMHHDSLRHVESVQRDNPEETTWNGHAVTDPASPLVGQFWEVPVRLFWGAYLAHPKATHITLENYNSLPKGTTFFLGPRAELIRACELAWPTENAALSSDDTKVLRSIAADIPIRLDPGFMAVYRPRTSVSAFVRHSFGRGTFLVDSFGGTSRGWNAALMISAVLPFLLVILAAVLLANSLFVITGILVATLITLLLIPAGIGIARRCPSRGVQSYLLFVLVFVVPYWVGILRGIGVHGAKLLRVETPATQTREISAS